MSNAKSTRDVAARTNAPGAQIGGMVSSGWTPEPAPPQPTIQTDRTHTLASELENTVDRLQNRLSTLYGPLPWGPESAQKSPEPDGLVAVANERLRRVAERLGVLAEAADRL